MVIFLFRYVQVYMVIFLFRYVQVYMVIFLFRLVCTCIYGDILI